MKFIHTSDWHIGRTENRAGRQAEFEAFLDWLASAVDRHGAAALLVSGDVFDSPTPGTRSQELYYRFLCRMAASPVCRHVVITAGNHDSPSFLNAPGELLRALRIHVLGRIGEDPEEEVLALADAEGKVELIVCAVPYLRDGDVRLSEAGESMEDKDAARLRGIRAHYARVAELAGRKRAGLGAEIPVVALGHLFVAGGRRSDGDGVRDLYAGSLGLVPADVFSPLFSYVALGHLHAPQKVSGAGNIRYSGSPLPMGFAEAGQRKSVCLVECADGKAEVALLDVPVFQEFLRVSGNIAELEDKLRSLARADSGAWLEITYTGEEIIGDLAVRLEALVSGTRMQIRAVKDARLLQTMLGGIHAGERLADLDVLEVFERCLDGHDVPDAQRPGLRLAYREILASLESPEEEAGAG
ncbi:MAG: exonuclease SbcCD subunit D C-terminal domain-containing protein [Desulfovibrio sp.]|jgi:exonuclease SbcD|nr:exonuclease SbcCD subunit D C-terminal domain-containing protein [Desulfovibrio sp.]